MLYNLHEEYSLQGIGEVKRLSYIASGDKEVKELSGEGYVVWYRSWGDRNSYVVRNKISKEIYRIEENDIRPKSIREKLHNINENKEFYESTLRN